VAQPGPKPRPALAVVREGNPGRRPVKEGVKLPPSVPVAPRWSEYFPGSSRPELRARQTATELWDRLAPSLARSAGLVNEQREVLIDYCVTWARIQQGERALSMEGPIASTERGNVKNPWSTLLNQYRSHLRSLIGELGLSPSAATRVSPRGGDGDDEDDIFD